MTAWKITGLSVRRFCGVMAAGSLAMPALAFGQLKLNATPISGGSVMGFSVTESGSRVVYHGDLTADSVTELYSASTRAAGTQVKLSSAPLFGDVQTDYQLTTDGSRVVYRGDLTTDGRIELYSASTTVPETQIRLNNAPTSSGSVWNFALTPDGSRVVYRGDFLTLNAFELFVAATTASGTQTRVHSAPVTGGDVSNFALTADGSRVVFSGDLVTDGETEIYSASVASPGSQVRLSSSSIPNGDAMGPLVLAPVVDRVAFRGILAAGDSLELYSTSVASAGGQVKLSSNDTGGSIGRILLQNSKGDRVVYDRLIDGDWQLFSASMTEPGTEVSLDPGASVAGIVLTSDGKRALYTHSGGSGLAGLFSVSLDDPASRLQISETLISGGGVSGFLLSEDGSRVVYVGDLVTDGLSQLYCAVPDEADSQVQLTFLSGTEDIDGKTPLFTLSSDGQWVAFVVTNGLSRKLMYTDLTGNGTPVEIIPYQTGSFNSLAFGPDNTLYFLSDYESPGTTNLYSYVIPEPTGLALLALAGSIFWLRKGRRWMSSFG